jgi:multiple sugar transport system ATP-binding protein
MRIPAGIPGPLRARAGRPVVLAVRPHQVHDAHTVPDAPTDARLTGVVERVERLGSDDLVYVVMDGQRICARFAPRTGPPRGEPAELAVDVADLQAFDPATDLAIWYGRRV